MSPLAHNNNIELGLNSVQSNCIYLDHAANSRLHPDVAECMTEFLSDNTPGNAQAAHHLFGSASNLRIREARQQIAQFIGAQPQELVFTSGATESNNLVFKGLVRHLKQIGKTHIVTSAVEHKSVLGPLAQLVEQGFSVSTLPVKPCGMIEANVIEPAINANTGIVSVQAVNNETGTVQPIAEIAKMLNGKDVLFHSDAAQALGKIPFDVTETGIDFASLSSHKVHGPQGVGALYIKGDKIQLFEPLITGGGQEFGLRSGTVPTMLCAGFGAACSLAENHREYLGKLRDRFLDGLRSLKMIVHGHKEAAWNVPGIINLRFPGIESDALVMALPGLAFGLGSACGTGKGEYSHVIKAITGSETAAKESIRISFDHFTRTEDIDAATAQIVEAVTGIRKLQGEE